MSADELFPPEELGQPARGQSPAAEAAGLRDQLNRWSHAYYVLARPEVGDQVYDQAYDRLVELERLHPELASPDSPTQRVGSDLSQDFPEFRHSIPVLSLDKAYSTAEILQWVKRCGSNIAADGAGEGGAASFACVLEQKIDGLSLVLYYRDGLLERAVTRGNGEVGNDVTANVRTIREVPLRLSRPVSGAFRGEVYLQKDDFRRLNAEQEVPYANPRNLAGGSLRRVRSSEVAAVPLRIFVYEGFYEGSPAHHMELLDDLKALGLPTNPRTVSVGLPEGLERLEAFIAAETAGRQGLPYEIDGLVVKVDFLAHRELLGYTGHHPRWAVAYKFESPQGTTRVLGIDVQVGRSGRITPVARVEPVAVGGTTIQNVTLHNQAYIDALELAVGDMVTVSRRGDVIPAVESVVEKGSGLVWQLPGVCPCCSSALVVDGAHHFCPNFDCPDRQRGRLNFFVGRDQMDIEGLGSETLDLLRREGIVKDLPDIFRLPYARLLRFEGFGDKKVANLEAAVELSKSRPFSVVLPALGLPDIGPKLTQLLLENGYRSMQSLFDLVDSGNPEALLDIKGIGPRTIERIKAELANPRLRALVADLAACGLRFEQAADAPAALSSRKDAASADGALPQIFAGQAWCVTGTFEDYKPRSKAMDEILKRGGRECDSVTKETTHLLVGADAGSKLEKARKLGIAVVDEPAFRAQLAAAPAAAGDAADAPGPGAV
jgi:DNA ligase (NAD+)